MKTSSVLASLLCSSLAVAAPHHQHVHKHAPFHKRALITKTELVVETVVIFTTVYPDDTPAATIAPAATSEPGLFYEKPSSKAASSSAVPAYTPPAEPAKPSSSSVYTPPPAPSSVYTPPPAPSSSSVYTPPPAEPSSVYTPPPAEPSSVYTPPPAEPSSVYTPPPAAVSSTAPAQSSAPASGGGATGGGQYSGDITIYDNTGAAGACGIPLYDSMEVCAIAHGLWEDKGGSTYDKMTGAATNPYCGKIATINYNGNTATCKIMDMCPGCEGLDLDLSVKTWTTLTGSEERTRYKATWSVAM
ncbi:hypothetical protein BDV96DRAFT_620607 [Lophiotrema nucula]|uniref:Mucin-like domain-containing protein n=1 Tax=Lophiotrema nucula TaxID=690887 RepID=A0A6A5ZF39_9PLEO|nr:hypothetical protein BDV96DRAFT_620607 [Lophiotrema nucula]